VLRHGQGLEVSDWSLEPTVVLALVAVLFIYAAGVRVARPGARPARWQQLSFGAGIALALIALSSPTATLSDDLFSVHMAQHTLLTNVAVPLALLGAPLLPALALLPRGARRAVVRSLVALRPVVGLAHFLTQPLVAAALYILTTLAWHAPAAYGAAVANDALHVVQHASFVGTAALFWAQVIDPTPFRAVLPLPGRILYVFAAGLPHHFITSTVLIVSERALYAPYVSSAPVFGLSPLSDQRLAGGIMAAGWSVTSIATLSALFFIWLDREEREQRARETRQRALHAATKSRPT
jgi:putative membrane protein